MREMGRNKVKRSKKFDFCLEKAQVCGFQSRWWTYLPFVHVTVNRGGCDVVSLTSVADSEREFQYFSQFYMLWGCNLKDSCQTLLCYCQ